MSTTKSSDRSGFVAAAMFVCLTTAVPVLGQGDPTFVYQTTIPGFSFPSARAVAVDRQGNSFVAADLLDARDSVIVKLDARGSVVWTHTITGNALENVGGIAISGGGDVYIVGRTVSDDFLTVNAIQPQKKGPSDAFIRKLDGEDGSVIFSTYFGGNRSDGFNDIKLNDAGEIVVAGWSDSIDFPVTPDAIQGNLTLIECFCDDAVVARLSADGSQVLYGTYLGGTFDEQARGLAIGPDGGIYITGTTRSEDFPTVNAAQPTFGGDEFDGFVARISHDGSVLDYSTYLGGEDWDLAMRIAVDGEGSAYITGSTRSIHFPTTPGAFQEQFAGEILGCEVPFGRDRNCFDAFVTKLRVGGGVDYSTYLGGRFDDEARGIAVDRLGQAYAVGYASSADYPPFNGGGLRAFIFLSKLDATGSVLEYTLPIDSGSANTGQGVGLDQFGAIYLSATVNVPSQMHVAKIVDEDLVAGGDMNCDGAIDAFDIEPFLLALFDPAGYAAQYPDCDVRLADIDGDGSVDAFDIEPFLALLFP